MEIVPQSKPPGVFQFRPGRHDGTVDPSAVSAKWYDPQRDLAHVFPCILRSALLQIQEPNSPIAEHLLEHGLKSVTTVNTAEALMRFTVGVQDRDVMNLLKTSGVLDADPKDLQLIGGFVLMVLLAWYHRGWGAANMSNENPADDLETYEREISLIVSKWLRTQISFFRHPILWIRAWLKG